MTFEIFIMSNTNLDKNFNKCNRYLGFPLKILIADLL